MTSNILSDIAINIIAAILFFILGFAGSKLWRVIKISRPIAEFWRYFTTTPTVIIVPTIPEKYKEESLEDGMSDLKAGSKIDGVLSKINEKIFMQEVKFATDKLINHNIILIGGPITNAITKEVMTKKIISYTFSDHTIQHRQKGLRFIPKSNANGQLLEDYGMIIRVHNYINPNKYILIIAGCYGYGTMIATEAITDPKILRKILRSKISDECVIIVKSKMIDSGYEKPKIVLIEEL